jgi:DNA-binding FrmR family transcriptional regulator
MYSGSTYSSSGGAAPSSGNALVQLVSLPQLDSIQRTLRILDVRLQHVQSNVRDEVRQRSDIDHIRRLMTENQNALSTVVTVLSSIQEEVRRISIVVYQQHTSTLHIQPPALTHHHGNSKQLSRRSSLVNSVRDTARLVTSLGTANSTPVDQQKKAGTCVYVGPIESAGSFV